MDSVILGRQDTVRWWRGWFSEAAGLTSSGWWVQAPTRFIWVHRGDTQHVFSGLVVFDTIRLQWLPTSGPNILRHEGAGETGLGPPEAETPQGTVLSPFLFTLYTTDFQYNTGSCHLQKFSDNSAVVGCISEGQEGEYRALVDNFVEWTGQNHLQLNISKTFAVFTQFINTLTSAHSRFFKIYLSIYITCGSVIAHSFIHSYILVLSLHIHRNGLFLVQLYR